MKRLLIALVAFLPVQAAALSCIAPDPLRTFHDRAAAPERYALVEGTLSFDPTRLPQTDFAGQPPAETQIPARLSGKALGRTGFTVPYARDITLRVLCFAHWCGGAVRDAPVMVFIERRDQGDRVTVDPCGGDVFPNPTPKMRRQMRDCITGGPCPKPTP